MKKSVTKRLTTVALSCLLVAGSMYVVPVASAAGQVFRDDFGAAGSTLTGWTTSGGTWTKSGNAAQGQINGNSSIGKLTRADQGTNFTFEADVIPKSQDAVGYLLFRSNSGYTNYYSVAVNNDTNSIVLYKTSGSTVTALDSDNVTIGTDNSYHVKIVASGSSINVYWNNSASASLTAADTAFSSGQFGLGVKNNVNYSNGTVQFDNVNVYDDAVLFATNGSAVPAKSVSTAVNVYPSGAGSLQYQWTQSSANPGSSGWTNFTNGETITKNSGDGDWYLHVRYVVSGTTYIAPSSNVFKLDNTKPVITLNGANPLVVALGGTFVDPGATAMDNLDGSVAVTVSGSVNTAAAGSYTLTYSATDSAGNSASATRTVTVADLTPPVITLIGPDSLTIELGSSYTDAGATAFDNVDGDLGALTPSGSVDTSQVGTYSLVFNVADAAGNAATAVTRTVHVQDTAVSHSFAPNGDATAHKTASTVATVTGSGISDLGYQWTQSSEEPAGGSWTSFASGETIGQLFGNGNWYLHVKYTKNAQEHQFVSNSFLLDNSKPVIALNGSATVTLNLGEAYTEQGATATDNIDTNLTVISSGSVNTSTAGTYTVSYNVADAAGNAADTVTRTVIVAQAGELETTLNGLASVGAGKPFTVTLGLKNVTDAVYAQDITVSFDPLKVEFESAASVQTGLSLISTTQTAPGQMRFILVSQGAEHAISGTAPVLQLNFKAKSLAEQTTSVIAATTAKVADGTGHEQLAATSSLSVSIQVAIPGDVNQDGTVSIGDLAMVAAYYGIDWLNPNWPLVENADSNDNHVIDIADLAAMAQKIVGE